MFENEAKGWYGSYSRVGKGYAERFYIISHKDEIFSRENKKIRIKDFFNPDEIKQKASVEETLDVFKIYTSNKKNKVKILKSLLKPKKTFLDYSLYKKKLLKKRKLKYNNKHNTLDSKYGPERHQPACTRYNPNYNYIKPKLLEGPLWKDIPGRNQKGLNPNEDKIFSEQIEDNKNYKYYLLETEKSKCLVNMNKTTQRGEFTDIKDLRIRTDKPFLKPKKRNKTLNSKLKVDNKNNNMRKLHLRNKSYRLVNKYNKMTSIFSEPRDLLEKEIQNISQKNIKCKKGFTKKKISKIILNEIGLFDNNNNNLKKNDDLSEKKSSNKLLKLKPSLSFSKEINSNYNSLTERNDKNIKKMTKKKKN